MKRWIIFLIFLLLISFNIICQVDPIHREKYFLVTSRIGLKLRNEPSKEAKIIDTIPFGTFIYVDNMTSELEIVDEISNIWYKTRFNEKDGWVFGGYIDKRIEENPLIGKWRFKNIESYIWKYFWEGTYLYGLEQTDNVYSGEYNLLGNRLILKENQYSIEDYQNGEMILNSIIIFNIEIVFINIDYIILKYEDGKEIELIRDE